MRILLGVCLLPRQVVNNPNCSHLRNYATFPPHVLSNSVRFHGKLSLSTDGYTSRTHFPMSLPNLQQIRAVTAQFESAWSGGERPWISDYLVHVEPPDRAALIARLVPDRHQISQEKR